ncbi:substrate-binding periplasmic protein [Undibacterium terreum]|uniref:ABC transporter substrate-binding protein n=1 Tax=Undibacterium terreum TaxID=1224302 RepID=A0A916U8Z1_9BURK|nr:transporter substrate-binding domain-containing protein [Undibacterium terreum]GGC64993.1 ABC transporter substrate-binding protein [Undibacterium terreum]
MMTRSKLLAHTILAIALSIGWLCGFAAEQIKIGAAINLRSGNLMAEKVLEEAYRKIGIQLVLERLPFARMTYLIEADELDGIAFGLVEPEKFAKNLVKIPIAVSYSDTVAFSTDKIFAVAGYESLRPYSIGYIAGVKSIEIPTAGMRVDPAPNLESMFKKLASGRTDIAIDNRQTICVARKLGLSNIHILEPSLLKISAYHFIQKKHHELIPRLTEVLSRMEKDGSIRRIQETTLRDYVENCPLDSK